MPADLLPREKLFRCFCCRKNFRAARLNLRRCRGRPRASPHARKDGHQQKFQRTLALTGHRSDTEPAPTLAHSVLEKVVSGYQQSVSHLTARKKFSKHLLHLSPQRNPLADRIIQTEQMVADFHICSPQAKVSHTARNIFKNTTSPTETILPPFYCFFANFLPVPIELFVVLAFFLYLCRQKTI